MRRGLEVGGVVAGIVLIAFGIAAIVMGADGASTVSNELEKQNIEGSPDMTPDAIKAEAEESGLSPEVELPDCDVAGEKIDDGDKARCFASYMQVHALEATGGYAYAEMGRYEAKPNTPKSELAAGGGTDSDEWAVKDAKTGLPADNEAREVWVTETALGTALNASYMADRLSIFGMVIGIALLLTGIGFLVLVFGGSVREPHLRRSSGS